jgi:predicted nucleic acid-binding protein
MAILVFDSAPLSCFARARRLPLLEQLTEGDERVTTRAVLDEMSEGVHDHAELQNVLELAWLQVKAVDGLEELRLFAEYARRLGAGRHNIGEASVLAWAEAHSAVAFTDDEVAVQAGRERGVRVQRTLALVARGVRRELLSETEAHAVVDELRHGGARFPFGPGEFIAWARQQGLFDKSRG